MAETLNILFVGSDAAAFGDAAEHLGREGHKVKLIASPFKALTVNAAHPADVTVIDVSRLDEQMLEVFEALREVAPQCTLLATVAPATRSRAAKVLNLGSDAIVGLPVDAAEIRALLKKRGRPAAVETTVDEKYQWLGDFAAGLAHNINNPLTTVVGYLQILVAKQGGSQGASVLPTMLKECDRISDIVKNLLLFAGTGNIEPKSVDVNRTVDAALVIAGTEGKNSLVRVERSYQPGLPPVMADEGALEIACKNIALNAWQAMKEGGVLSVSTARNGSGHVVIKFRDTGPGVPPAEVNRIFEPFYTGEEEGVGLGLSASYGIVKTFGGTINVDSRPGQGTIFAIELPAGPQA